jgi:hypothetical protein
VKSEQRNCQMTQKQYKDYVDKRHDMRILWTSHHVEEVFMKGDQEKLSNGTNAIQKNGDGGPQDR